MKQNPSFHSMAKNDVPVDPKSGFCSSDCVFYSTRKPLDLPNDEFMDVTTFVSTRNHSGKIALIDAATGEEISYAQLWQAVNSLAGSLSDLGIKQGHVVLLLSPNSIHFPIICLAVMSVGAIITTTNPLNTPSEISKQAGDSKAILAFTVPELIGKLAGIQLPVVLIGAEANHIPNLGRLKLVSSLQQLMERKTHHTHQTYQPRTRTRVRQHDTATLLYSSGTTGASKGVISSHRNLIASILTVMTRFKGHHTFLCTVPMFHIYGLAAFATGLLGSGSTIVILSKFEMEEMLWAIQRYRVSYFPLVPPILTAMANNPDLVRKYDLSSLQTVLSGGAPLSKEVIEGFLARFTGITILQGYGLTESAGVGASTDSQEESMHYGTAGLLSPNMEAQIVDPDTGEALPVNRKGELWLRGPSVMKGYFSNPEATASTLDSDGWLRTGDLCYIDDGGYIFVVDRLKELIKYKGYQVAPAELEALLLTHPEIADAAVIPYPDKEAGQHPMAYVARKAGSNLSESQVMEFVAAQVAPYKKIRRVAFVNGIPKNPSGKILRKDLIKLAASRL